jgi:hypothetical protein
MKDKYVAVRWMVFLWFVWCLPADASSGVAQFDVGVAVRDITPSMPVDLEIERVDTVAAPLHAKAIAFKDRAGTVIVLVSVDTPVMARGFSLPLVQAIGAQLDLEPSHIILISTHTHAAPFFAYIYNETPGPKASEYLEFLRKQLTEVVEAAVANMKPAELDFGVGRATFAMNRRAFTANGAVEMLPNPDGPVDWDVPVLKARSPDGSVRAILFGYACHAVAGDGDALSPDYPGYAEQELQLAYPGSVAVYLTGFGGDQNPYPREEELLDPAREPWPNAGGEHNADQPYARRHGLELAGAVAGVMARPMQVIEGSSKLAYREVELRLTAPPSRQQIEADAHDPAAAVNALGGSPVPGPGDTLAAAANRLEKANMKRRAEDYLSILKNHRPLPQSVSVPLAALRLGDLTMLFMSYEPVVDYSLRFKRLFGADRLWLVGYAYESGFYIPSARLLKEGGYETDRSFAEAGFYGRFDASIENTIVQAMLGLVAAVRDK